MAWKFFTRDGAEKQISGTESDRGTTFPTSPFDGQQYAYVADATNGVVWYFKYNAGSASSFKWEFIGGGELWAEVATQETLDNATYGNLATTGPAITLARAGDYIVTVGVFVDDSTAPNATNSYGYMSYAIGATAATDADAALYKYTGTSGVTSTYAGHAVRSKLKTGIAASTTLTAKYRTSASGNFGSFAQRWMKVVPVRVS